MFDIFGPGIWIFISGRSILVQREIQKALSLDRKQGYECHSSNATSVAFYNPTNVTIMTTTVPSEIFECMHIGDFRISQMSVFFSSRARQPSIPCFLRSLPRAALLPLASATAWNLVGLTNFNGMSLSSRPKVVQMWVQTPLLSTGGDVCVVVCCVRLWMLC